MNTEAKSYRYLYRASSRMAGDTQVLQFTLVCGIREQSVCVGAYLCEMRTAFSERMRVRANPLQMRTRAPLYARPVVLKTRNVRATVIADGLKYIRF